MEEDAVIRVIMNEPAHLLDEGRVELFIHRRTHHRGLLRAQIAAHADALDMIAHVVNDPFGFLDGLVCLALVLRQHLFGFVVDADELLQLFLVDGADALEHGEIVALVIDALCFLTGAGEEGFVVAVLEGGPVSVEEEAALGHAHPAAVHTGGDPFSPGVHFGLEGVRHDEAVLIAGMEHRGTQRSRHDQLVVAMEAPQHIILHAGEELHQVRHLNVAGVQAQVFPQVVICKC